jgi:probable rRNA maturation factor
LLKINEQYLNHNYYTDIVTFDYVENSVISGDLFISVDRVEENASQLGVSFDEELYRVIFHGILHLCGYNDKTIAEKEMMREKEDFYLEKSWF